MTKISVAFLIGLFTLFFGLSPANEQMFDWNIIKSNDTLQLLLNGNPIGSMVHSIHLDSNNKVITISILSEIVSENGSKRKITMNHEEIKKFDYKGVLFESSLKIISESGVNSWNLYKQDTAWQLKISAGGSETVRLVPKIKQSIMPLYKIYKGIRERNIQVGQVWYDTSFELTSMKYMHSVLECKEVPSVNNNNMWVFTCTDDLSKRTEKWVLDSNGTLIYQDIPPFSAKRIGKIKLSKSSGNIQNLFDVFMVKKNRLPTKDEKVCLQFDSTIHLDSSIMTYYTKKSAEYFILKDKLPECKNDSGLNSVKIDAFLQPTVTMQSNDSLILSLGQKIIKDEKDICKKIAKISEYVFNNLQKRNAATFSSALETLKNGYGDCGEHAVLTGALLRSVKIPSQVVMGLVYVPQKGGFFYHAWVMAFNGSWIFIDPALGEYPLKSLHVPLVIDNDGTSMVKFSQFINRISISYVKN